MRPFIRYVIIRYEEYQKEMAYRIFITDALYKDADHMVIPARKRWYEIIHPQTIQKSGDEIAADVIAKAGLVVKK